MKKLRYGPLVSSRSTSLGGFMVAARSSAILLGAFFNFLERAKHGKA